MTAPALDEERALLARIDRTMEAVKAELVSATMNT